MAHELNLTVYTLRYYDKEGLLPFVERTDSGIRRFKESDIEALRVIECLKSTGMPIKEIKKNLSIGALKVILLYKKDMICLWREKLA